MNEKRANIGAIFGTALFGVVNDLSTAKENGQKLPGILDDVATLALEAKKEGVNFAKEEAKQQVFKYIPWVALAIAIVVILFLYSKKA